jgi:serine/threonine protein kinase
MHSFLSQSCALLLKLQCGQPYNTKSDIWALGCVIYELLALKHAFEAANIGVCTRPAAPTISRLTLQPGRLVMRIMSAEHDPIPSQYSDGLAGIINSMLALNPDDRPSVSQLLDLPMLREARDGLQSAGLRNSMDLASHLVGDCTPVSQGGVSPTTASSESSSAVVSQPLPPHHQPLSIDANLQPHPLSSLAARSCTESVSPITPVGSDGGSSSLTSPQLPDSAVKFPAPSLLPNASDSLQMQQHISENYVDDFEPEPDDAWEAQLPRGRSSSSEIEPIQEEEGALRTDSANQPDFIEDECSDGSYEDDFDAEQDIAIPAVKLNGSICAVPLIDASSGKGRGAFAD